MEVSAGKLWSLRRLAGRDGLFRMVAVDQRPGVEALIAARLGLDRAPYEKVGAFKRLLIEELTGGATAMLVDPGYAYPYASNALDPAKGLLLTLEQWACEETPGGRKTLIYPGWSVDKIKRLGADGVKLMLWYRPDAAPDVLAHQQVLVEKIGRACRRADIAFLLEPLVYPLGGEEAIDYVEDAGKRPELVVATVEEFRKERYGIDIFKLESPVPAAKVPPPEDDGAEAAETLGWFLRIDGLLDRPWVMLSAGAGMEPFRRIVAYAARAGASGYLAGRAIWWSAAEAYPDIEVFRQRLRTEASGYVETLGDILRRHGRPWHARPAFAEGIRLAHAGPDFPAVYPAES